MTREEWLNSVARKLENKFNELGYTLGKFRVSVGFTSGGKRGKSDAEVWSNSLSADGNFEVFIRPDEDDPFEVSAKLCHEMCHIAVGLGEGHKGRFKEVMMKFGMDKPFTSSVATEKFKQIISPFLQEVGVFPHGKLDFKDKPTTQVTPIETVEGLSFTQGETYSSAKPKQGTRLLKVCCSECGYTVRTTQKWLDVGVPHCPLHGEMLLEDKE